MWLAAVASIACGARDAHDAVHVADEEPLRVAAEFRDDELARGLVGVESQAFRQADHGQDRAAQRNDPGHARGHVGRLGDRDELADFAHLEHVDAEGLAAPEREQQELHAVGAGQAGLLVDHVHQAVIAGSHFLRVLFQGG
jgi:hypothetical protein